MAKAMSLDEYIKRANSVHDNFYDYFCTVYKNMSCKITIRCPLHGEFEQLPQAHLRGQGCPLCGREKQKRSVLEKYGVDNPMKVKSIQDKARNTCIERYGTAWAMSTQAVKDKVTETNIVKYGVFRPLQNPDIRCKANDTLVANYGVSFSRIHECSEIMDKVTESCIERYGSKTYLGSKVARNAINATCQERYGGNAPLCSESVRERVKETVLERYGVEYPSQSSVVKEKICLTKAEHGTFSSSKPELVLYQMLCDFFGDLNVKRNYCSDVYPYACDFYVVSRDMFIELNASWTHGGHWYDPGDEADISRRDLWVSRGTKYYLNAVHVWTVADVNKRLCAERNCLNYVVFWDSDLRDAQEWFDKGCPDKLF